MALADVKKWKSVTRFSPDPLPESDADLGIYIQNQLIKLGDILFNQSVFRLDETFTLPAKPRNGDMRFFDGTTANPGAGRGIYWYDGDASAWQKL